MGSVNALSHKGRTYPLKVLLQATDQPVELLEIVEADGQHAAAAASARMPTSSPRLRGQTLLQLL